MISLLNTLHLIEVVKVLTQSEKHWSTEAQSLKAKAVSYYTKLLFKWRYWVSWAMRRVQQ